MRSNVKRLGAMVLLALLAGLVPPGVAAPRPVPAASRPAAEMPPNFFEALRQAEATSDSIATVDLDFSVDTQQELAPLKQAVKAAGGEVLTEGTLYVRARVPVAAAESIPAAVPVTGVGTDQKLTLDLAKTPTAGRFMVADEVEQLKAYNQSPIGADDFRSQFGATGAGVKVAIIDTGIDPLHPALLKTPAGGLKIVDWQDFTREGYVNTSSMVPWDVAYTASDNKRYLLPVRPAVSQSARFGYWEEHNVPGYINQDLDQNGDKTDRFAVLLVDSVTQGRYDTAYVDTNSNNDFRDEQPLKLHSDGQSVGRLGRRDTTIRANRRLNFVVAGVDPEGKWVSFGFDGNGHGTQVAGVLGAYNPDGYSGIAPGVEIMALKAVMSTGDGYWFPIKDAIQYAATHGANIINISIGGLADGAARFYDSGASEWLNRMARDYGVLIVVAAANTGPGLSSGTTLGNPSEVMAVGSYYSPEMWKRDYNYIVPNESVWYQSGMGPRADGCFFPNVIAPGGAPTTSPLWRDPTGYGTAKGTSIATPHVAGSAALLLQAAKRDGLGADRVSLKRALELSARKLAGFEAYEQGFGLVQIPAAYLALQQLEPVPVIQARTSDGNGGLHGRSVTNAGSTFTLTNLGSTLTRVSVESSTAWVRPGATSLTLPPAIARQLPIQVVPPTQPGVHSSLITLTQPGLPGPVLTIPVTHVQPVDLSTSPGNRYTSSDTLEVARYRRTFFRVPSGTASLSASFRVALNEQNAPVGTIEVHVFRPDGQAVYQAELGVNGRGLSGLFQATEPVEGVWEIVVTAKPDSRLDALMTGYSLEVESKAGPVQGQPLRFAVPAGTTTTVPVKLLNTYGAFTGNVEAMGVVKPDPRNLWNMDTPWRVERTHRTILEDFTLKHYVGQMRVEISNVVPSNADVNLYLYHFDPNRGVQVRGQSVTAGTSNEVIELLNLPEGRYQVIAVVASPGDDSYPMRYQYRRLMGVDVYNVTTVDAVRRHGVGEIWNTQLRIEAPTTPGRYYGHLLVRDTEQKKTLGWIPFEVSVGQPALSVQAMSAQLVRNRASKVVLELREAGTGRLTDGTVLVNGLRYISRNGQVSVPVTPVGPAQVLDVEVDLPAYQFTQQRLTLPVRDIAGVYPFGTDSGEENGSWRRKVLSQMR